VIPAGSFVKGKLLSGVEAPEGKALPVLLQADFAFIGPNKTRIDLAGCFMIAKSTGNLSIERVEMQATKLSCVAKSGQMFERDINGFVADDKDNSFAVMGTINTKQDRVAVMAFLSSVVEGVGKAVQQAQTSTKTNEIGTSQTIIDGDQTKFALAGGASNAASMVTQWYLKQAQNLLPTINVGSGQDVWIIMQDSVSLPNSYFKRNDQRSHSNAYSYLSRVID
jgi:conjugal transfer pilus assembly protein TraB